MAEIDPTIKHAMDQDFADGRARMRLLGETAAAGNNFVHESMREQFLHESRLVGAAAAARLDRDQLAHQILQQNSARDQPGGNKA